MSISALMPHRFNYSVIKSSKHLPSFYSKVNMNYWHISDGQSCRHIFSNTGMCWNIYTDHLATLSLWSHLQNEIRVNIPYGILSLFSLLIYINHSLLDSDSQAWLGIRITRGAFWKCKFQSPVPDVLNWVERGIWGQGIDTCNKIFLRWLRCVQFMDWYLIWKVLIRKFWEHWVKTFPVILECYFAINFHKTSNLLIWQFLFLETGNVIKIYKHCRNKKECKAPS